MYSPQCGYDEHCENCENFSMSAHHKDPRWARARKQALTRDGHRCVACGRGTPDGVRLHVDHIVRIEDGGEPWDLTNLQTLCAPCHHRKSGRELARDNKARAARNRKKPSSFEAAAPTPAPLSRDTPEPPGVSLDGSEVAGAARFLSDPHPDAAGTRGPEWGRWMVDTFGQAPRPWQQQVADRMLEVDAEGTWCWGSGFLVSVPRQFGKSWLLRGVLGWLASQGLLVIATTNRLTSAAEVLRPLGIYVDERGGKWRQTMNQPSVEWPGGPGRLVFQAATDSLGVGWSPQAAAVDEAWDVGDVPVLQGLIPAMAACPNPFLLLTSTVGTVTSVLLARFREAALSDVETAVGLAEWSAPAGADWRDEDVWRQASPEWSPQRLRFMRQQVRVLSEAQFRSQLLNQQVSAENAWVPQSRWAAASGAQVPPERPHVAALEVTLDGSRIYAVAAHRDEAGVVHTALHSFRSYNEADAWLRFARPAAVLAAPHFRDRVHRIDRLVGAAEVAGAMPAFMAALMDGRLRHPGDPRLDEQVLAAEAKVTKAGVQTLIAQDGRSLSALRALLWAVAEAGVERSGRPRLRVAAR